MSLLSLGLDRLPLGKYMGFVGVGLFWLLDTPSLAMCIIRVLNLYGIIWFMA